MTSTLEQELRTAAERQLKVIEVGHLDGGFMGAVLLGDKEATQYAGNFFGEHVCFVSPANILALLDRLEKMREVLDSIANTYDDSWREGSQERRIGDLCRAALEAPHA